ncbi:hypothetical protein V5799_014528 [Amblyomma americanum]|uniref:Uncharacterized protein n=1 Tax=Amblyomma americanum TaxID=6943 RepID=A0AAQ4E2S3_AMBAM
MRCYGALDEAGSARCSVPILPCALTFAVSPPHLKQNAGHNQECTQPEGLQEHLCSEQTSTECSPVPWATHFAVTGAD